VGKPVDVMFVHSDSKMHDAMSRKGNYRIFSFFDYVPQMSDVLREYLLSAPVPTCVGYQKEGNEYNPVFDIDTMESAERELIEQIQNGAVDFLEEFYDNFGTVLEYIPYKSTEMAMVMEGFLRYSNDVDRALFSKVKFDDVLYGGEREINLKEIVDLALEWLPDYSKE
jgi:hypothetical protein